MQPFWPTGSGCARGVLSALDAAWMIRSFAMDKPPLQIISERENVYRLLSGTNDENLNRNHAGYTINPSTRYKNISSKKIREVYHLYDTDDPVNADFSLGSPTANKGEANTRRTGLCPADTLQYDTLYEVLFCIAVYLLTNRLLLVTSVFVCVVV